MNREEGVRVPDHDSPNQDLWERTTNGRFIITSRKKKVKQANARGRVKGYTFPSK